MDSKHGEAIKIRREAEGWSLEELSNKVGVTSNALWKMEKGIQRIDSRMMVKFAKIFDISLDELFMNQSKKKAVVTQKKSTNSGKLNEQLLYVIQRYNKIKEESFKDHSMRNFIRDTIPETLYKELSLDKEYFRITGSAGQGQWAEIPWVGIFIKDITITTSRGYYIAFLFKADGTGVYLSLNQGWGYFKEKYGAKIGEQRIKNTACYLRKNLSLSSDRINTNFLSLEGRGPLAKNYEKGHIIGQYYDVNSFPPSEVILDDIIHMLKVYEEINSLKGKRSIEAFNDYLLLEDDGLFDDQQEESFQISIQEIIAEDSIKKSYEESLEKRRSPFFTKDNTVKFVRRSKIAAIALKEANYKCAVDKSHQTFTSKITGEQYVEAHHIVPMYKQDEYEYELDQISNIASLCPNCHRILHHGTNQDKGEVLTKLYNNRKERLEEIGIGITLLQLKKMYNILIE